MESNWRAMLEEVGHLVESLRTEKEELEEEKRR